MSLLLGKKHCDIRAWEDVLFTGNHSAQPDIALYTVMNNFMDDKLPDNAV